MVHTSNSESKITVTQYGWSNQRPNIDTNTEPGRHNFDPNRSAVGVHGLQIRIGPKQKKGENII